MTACVVYWLHLPEHTDPAVEGYVGKTVNTAGRWRAHRSSKRFPLGYIETILFEGSEAECLAKERDLRSAAVIGWNVMPGGGQPPSQKGKKQGPRQFTDDHRRNLSAAHVGQVAWNKGLSGKLRGDLNPAKRLDVRKKISESKLHQPSCKAIEFNGQNYPSIKAAARYLGIPSSTFRRMVTGENRCRS